MKFSHTLKRLRGQIDFLRLLPGRSCRQNQKSKRKPNRKTSFRS